MEPLQQMQEEKKPNGALIGSIVVILVLILGGIYFWMSKVEEQASTEQEQAKQNLEAAIIEANNSLGSIETDMSTSGVNSLDLTTEVDALE